MLSGNMAGGRISGARRHFTKSSKKRIKASKKNDAARSGCQTIGIIGAGRHTGVTHLCVWLANYLTSAGHLKTAVLEWNDHGDFDEIRALCTDGKNNDSNKEINSKMSFQLLNVDYYPRADADVWIDCLNYGYQRIIIDFGEVTPDNLYDCVRCDQAIMVGSLTEWQLKSFLENLKMDERPGIGWRYTAAFGSEESRKTLQRRFRQTIDRIPISVDAFTISRADLNFFKVLIN